MTARISLLILFLAGFSLPPVALASVSDNQGGMYIGAYSVGNNLLGNSNVIIEAPAGEYYTDSLGCSSGPLSRLMLVDTGDGTYKLILSQIIAAAALGQKVTFYLASECADVGWNLQLPRVIGVSVPVRS